MSEWINPIGTTNDTEVKSIPLSEPGYAIPCAACGKAVSLTQSEARYTTFRLCDECIKAIKWAKIQMKSANMNIDGDDGK